MSCTILATEET